MFKLRAFRWLCAYLSSAGCFYLYLQIGWRGIAIGISLAMMGALAMIVEMRISRLPVERTPSDEAANPGEAKL